MFQIIVFISLFATVNAFLQIPPQMIPVISKLENIVTTKAIGISFFTNLRSEINIDRVFKEIVDMHYTTYSYLYLSMFLTYAYGYYKFTQGSQSCQLEKFKKIEKFDKVNRLTKELIFIILFIFTKDVQNAI